MPTELPNGELVYSIPVIHLLESGDHVRCGPLAGYVRYDRDLRRVTCKNCVEWHRRDEVKKLIYEEESKFRELQLEARRQQLFVDETKLIERVSERQEVRTVVEPPDDGKKPMWPYVGITSDYSEAETWVIDEAERYEAHYAVDCTEWEEALLVRRVEIDELDLLLTGMSGNPHIAMRFKRR